jgi:hypothetical protein
VRDWWIPLPNTEVEPTVLVFGNPPWPHLRHHGTREQLIELAHEILRIALPEESSPPASLIDEEVK